MISLRRLDRLGTGAGADPELEAPGTFWERERERIRSWKLRAHSGSGNGSGSGAGSSGHILGIVRERGGFIGILFLACRFFSGQKVIEALLYDFFPVFIEVIEDFLDMFQSFPGILDD